MFMRIKTNHCGTPGGGTGFGPVTRLLICICASLGASGMARANLVLNPGFETENAIPAIPPPNWSSNGGNGLTVDLSFANTGNYDVSFGAIPGDANPGILSQSIPTVAGTVYNLSFAVLDEAGGAGNTFRVTFGSFTATIAGDVSGGAYVLENFVVPGAAITGANTVLSFRGLNAAAAWNLDDVSVNTAAIPEPGTASLLGSAMLSGLVLAGRRPKVKIT